MVAARVAGNPLTSSRRIRSTRSSRGAAVKLGSARHAINSRRYARSSSLPGANTYSYDANGNMLTRTESGVTYTQTWDAENRLQTVTVVGQTTTYTYDGDGQRVKKVQGGQTTVYIGNCYEKNLGTGVVTKYYYAGGQRVAQRQGSTVYYFTGDHPSARLRTGSGQHQPDDQRQRRRGGPAEV
jgi:YD repeat-containing protein